MVNTTIQRIKKIKIQGATNVAIESLKLVKFFVNKHRKTPMIKLSTMLNELKNKLVSLRATEPMQYNLLRYVVANTIKGKDTKDMVSEINKKINHIYDTIKKSKQKIDYYGSNLVKDGMTIYTHCHSSSVLGALKTAKKDGKTFSVNFTETRPLFQGKKTALELIKNKIHCTEYVDSSIPMAIEKSDVVFLGCDSIIPGYFYNKTGTKIVYEFAKKYDKPIYVLTNSLKVDPRSFEGIETEVEQRSYKEIWAKKSKYLTIANYAFDETSIEGVIIVSELGVLTHGELIDEIRKVYPWVFE